MDPLQVSLIEVADFLVYLHEEKKLAKSTIEGYRTAIGHVLRAVGVDMMKGQALSTLMVNIARDVQEKPKVAGWDLALVLETLNAAPFEPLQEASLKCLTLKMTFFLALASRRRRSEIHTRTRHLLMRTENWGIVTLAPDVKFIAKTEGQSGNVVQRTWEIKALAKFLGQDMEQDKLCPVQAIRIHTERTDELRGDRERLILSFKEGM